MYVFWCKIIIAHRAKIEGIDFVNLKNYANDHLNLCWQSRKFSCVCLIFHIAISNLASLDAWQLPIYLLLLHSNYKITSHVPRRCIGTFGCLLNMFAYVRYRSSLRHSHRNVGRRATMRYGENKLRFTWMLKPNWKRNFLLNWLIG